MRGWRKPTWAIAVWTTLMALWFVAGMQRVNVRTDSGAAAAAVGTFVIAFVWVLILIPLALLWFGTRPR